MVRIGSKCTAETQSAQRFLAIARCVLCREVGEDRASNWYAPRAVGLMEIVKSAPCAVGLMKIENLFRYTALAVGLKPSASQGEARLHRRA